LHRSQQVNLTVSGSLQNKKLNDQRGADASSTDKNSTTLPLALNFDRRDGRGVTYGTVSWTSGQLGLDSALRTADAQAHTEGSFNKFNVDVARMQSLNWGQSGDFSLYARLSAQHANKNLDSSEDFGLGGVTGVRAYPSGEAYGDSGWLTQFELRHTIGAYAPYVFYDAGSIKTNANPWSTGVNDRTIAGAGFGLRYQRAGWSLDAALAWRTVGGLPQSDTQDLREQGPQIWLSLGWRF
jgi:hemolysin activation/secretion protein